MLTASVLVQAENLAIEQITWVDLQDTDAQSYEDPYRDLSRDQTRQLARLLNLRHQLENSGLSPGDRKIIAVRLLDQEAELAATGIDVEWLLSQRTVVSQRRQRAAMSVNESLSGRVVGITGYLFPGKYGQDGQYSAFLLPSRGVCMHLPNPPPNQLIRVLLPEWPPVEQNCVKAKLTGQLDRQETKTVLPTVEHELIMWSMWQMETTSTKFPDYE